MTLRDNNLRKINLYVVRQIGKRGNRVREKGQETMTSPNAKAQMPGLGGRNGRGKPRRGRSKG